MCDNGHSDGWNDSGERSDCTVRATDYDNCDGLDAYTVDDHRSDSELDG